MEAVRIIRINCSSKTMAGWHGNGHTSSDEDDYDDDRVMEL